MLADIGILTKEISFQQKQLGIDKSSLMKKAEFLHITHEDLIEKIISKCSDNKTIKSYYRLMLKSAETLDPDQISGPDICSNFMKFSSIVPVLLMESGVAGVAATAAAATEPIESAIKVVLPVVGSVIAAAMSGSSTFGLLKTTLNSCRILAEKCLEVKNNLHAIN